MTNKKIVLVLFLAVIIVTSCDFFIKTDSMQGFFGDSIPNRLPIETRELTSNVEDVVKGTIVYPENEISEDEELINTIQDSFTLYLDSLNDEERQAILSDSQAEVSIELEECLDLGLQSRQSAIKDNPFFKYLYTLWKIKKEFKEVFKDKIVSELYIKESDTDIWNLTALPEPIPAYQAAKSYLENGKYEYIQYLEKDLSVIIEPSLLTFFMHNNINARSSSGSASNFDDIGLIPNWTGSDLKHGDIIIVHGNGSFSGSDFQGYWTHAGFFDRNKWEQGSKDEWEQCMLTAEPTIHGTDTPEEYRADHPGKAGCYDTLSLYNHLPHFIVIRPKIWTQSRANTAISQAKSIFYNKGSFGVPWLLELIRIRDTSHDMTTIDKSYCTKVIWTGWKKAGVDVDARTMFGNLIAPKELLLSAYDRYRQFTITIKLLFRTYRYTYSKKIYTATTRIIMEKRR